MQSIPEKNIIKTLQNGYNCDLDMDDAMGDIYEDEPKAQTHHQDCARLRRPRILPARD
jgi:hypothetical protein